MAKGQYYKASPDVWASRDITPAAKVVHAYLRDCANSDGLAWPKTTTIQQTCGMNRSTVASSLKRLADSNLIEFTGKKNTVSVWRICKPVKCRKNQQSNDEKSNNQLSENPTINCRKIQHQLLENPTSIVGKSGACSMEDNLIQEPNSKNQEPGGENEIEFGGFELPQRKHSQSQSESPTQTPEEREAIAHVQRAWRKANGNNPAKSRCPGNWYNRDKDNNILKTLAERGIEYIRQVQDWVIIAARRRCEADKKVFGWGWICVYLDSPEFDRERAKRQKAVATPPDSREIAGETPPDTSLEEFESLPDGEKSQWLDLAKSEHRKISRMPLSEFGATQKAAALWKQQGG